MITVRPYRKLDWFEFLEIIEEKLKADSDEKTYFSLIDELYMRKVDSISEGATYKLKSPAKRLLDSFQRRLSNTSDFSSQERATEFNKQAHYIIASNN